MNTRVESRKTTRSLTVDVIIPTVDRHEVLLQELADLEKQTVKPTSVIVVDQSEDAWRHPIIRTGSIKYMHVDIKSLPHARNIGLSASHADIVIYVDDDVELPRDFIKHHLESYADSTVAAVAGKVIEHSGRRALAGTTPKHMFGYDIFGRASANRGGDTVAEVAAFPGGNFSLRRDDAARIGDFDELFQGTAIFEETDYAYRLRRAGYRIVFNPQAQLFHKELASGGCRPVSEEVGQYWRFRNATLFYLKNKSWLGLPLFVATYVAIAIYKAIQLRAPLAFFRLVLGLVAGLLVFIKGRPKI